MAARHAERQRYAWVLLVGLAALVVTLATTQAQAPKAGADFRVKAYETHMAMTQASPYKDQTGRTSGRPTSAAASPTSPSPITATFAPALRRQLLRRRVGSRDDLGQTWQPVFDKEASTSTGALAVAPSNPDILWVGTGESNIFRSSYTGVGVYKSTDNAKTLQHMGLDRHRTIGRIVIHPTDPNIVYVASAGQEWMENEMRGVFKTTDGGRTWTTVAEDQREDRRERSRDGSEDPNTLYAAAWQRQRRKWNDPRVEAGLQRERHLQDDRRAARSGRS